MRRYAWFSLFALITVLACGEPSVHDIGDGPEPGALGDDDDGGGGDDDDDGATTGGSPTPTPPNPNPTLTNVPSFATWNASLRTVLDDGNCTSCHAGGGSGGYSLGPNSDPVVVRYQWFTAICNRDGGADDSGTQSYDPPTGRFFENYNGMEVANNHANDLNPTAIPDQGPLIANWFLEGSGTTPPSCLNAYNLDDSM